jgi:hypothetical protein
MEPIASGHSRWRIQGDPDMDMELRPRFWNAAQGTHDFTVFPGDRTDSEKTGRIMNTVRTRLQGHVGGGKTRAINEWTLF